MNRLLAVVAVIALCVVGLGFYLGWFQIRTTSSDGTTQFNLTVDQKKIQESENEAKERLRGKK